jgi:ribose 5-phosphate isomerase B
MKKIVIGGDHAGFEYKAKIVKYLSSKGYKMEDMGPHSTDSVDYPDFVHPVANKVEERKAAQGILICGSGNGVAMTANKHKKIRAALCWNTDLAKLARQHNNANVLCIPARFVTYQMALAMVKVFIVTDFEKGRHARRVRKIGNC